MLVHLIYKYNSRAQVDVRLVSEHIHVRVQFHSKSFRLKYSGFLSNILVMQENASSNVTDVCKWPKFSIWKSNREAVVEQ